MLASAREEGQEYYCTASDQHPIMVASFMTMYESRVSTHGMASCASCRHPLAACNVERKCPAAYLYNAGKSTRRRQQESDQMRATSISFNVRETEAQNQWRTSAVMSSGIGVKERYGR